MHIENVLVRQSILCNNSYPDAETRKKLANRLQDWAYAHFVIEERLEYLLKL